MAKIILATLATSFFVYASVKYFQCCFKNKTTEIKNEDDFKPYGLLVDKQDDY